MCTLVQGASGEALPIIYLKTLRGDLMTAQRSENHTIDLLFGDWHPCRRPVYNLTIPAATLREQFHIRNEDLFNITEIRSGMDKLMLSYRDKGYREATVEPVIWIDDNHRIVEIKFRVTEGPHTA